VIIGQAKIVWANFYLLFAPQTVIVFYVYNNHSKMATP